MEGEEETGSWKQPQVPREGKRETETKAARGRTTFFSSTSAGSAGPRLQSNDLRGGTGRSQQRCRSSNSLTRCPRCIEFAGKILDAAALFRCRPGRGTPSSLPREALFLLPELSSARGRLRLGRSRPPRLAPQLPASGRADAHAASRPGPPPRGSSSDAREPLARTLPPQGLRIAVA